MSLARSIEYLLTPVRASSRRRLLDACADLRRRFPADPVLACDETGTPVEASDEARRLLRRAGVRPADVVGHPAVQALARRGAPESQVEIAPARGELGIVVRAVRQDGRWIGAVLVLRDRENRDRRVAAARDEALAPLAGEDPAFREALRLAARAARSSETVLLTGETGTGKELVAKAIHALGPRAAKPLVAVNCAALPRELAESELFGYERGAFTGADRVGKSGRFELAHGGTLFLDEIGELPLDLQGKLLRVLDERTVFPLGASRPRAVDVRIVAATNRDLSRCVADGSFRLDLYHRLSVLEISLPPLRLRGGDVLALARRFLAEACAREGRRPPELGSEVERVLLRYPWPGNVRELRNVATHVAHWCDADEVRVADLPPRLLRDVPPALPAGGGSLREIELDLLERTLAACGGNASEAARRLGIDRSTIYRRRRAQARTAGAASGER